MRARASHSATEAATSIRSSRSASVDRVCNVKGTATATTVPTVTMIRSAKVNAVFSRCGRKPARINITLAENVIAARLVR